MFQNIIAKQRNDIPEYKMKSVRTSHLFDEFKARKEQEAGDRVM